MTFARVPLDEIRESVNLLGEHIELLVGPRTFMRAQEDAGARLVWVETSAFIYGGVTVRLRTTEAMK